MATTQGIKLDDDTQARLKVLAEQKGRTSHWLMKTAITEYLSQEERYEQEKAEDMARWENYVLTGNAIGDETATAWLKGLADGHHKPWSR